VLGSFAGKKKEKEKKKTCKASDFL